MVASITDTHFTDEQFAQYMGVTTKTTHRWRQRGDGPPYIRRGAGCTGRIFYNMQSVERWLASRERGRAA